MGKRRSRKKSGRASTPVNLPSEPPNETQTTPQDMVASGTNILTSKEGNTIYLNVERIDTLVAGDAHHHYQHASRSAQKCGAQVDKIADNEYREMEIETKFVPTTEPSATERSGVVSDPKILQNMQKLIGSYHNIDEWAENAQLCKDLFMLFKQQGNASLRKIRFDSVHFFVRVKLGADYDAFLRSCKDGTLSRGLTKLLVTSELEKAAGYRLGINLNFKGFPPGAFSAFDFTVNVWTNLQKVDKGNFDAKTVVPSSIPVMSIQDMNPTDVKKWLVEEVHIPSSVAAKFAEAGVDGELLIRYEEKDLLKDFELPTGIMRKIIYARDDRMKTRVTPHEDRISASDKDSNNPKIHTGDDVVQSNYTELPHEDKKDTVSTAVQEVQTTSKELETQEKEDLSSRAAAAVKISQPISPSKGE